MKTDNICQCEEEGILRPGMERMYESDTELPFVNHQPGQCKCTNELQRYMRAGVAVTLCSCCVLSTDKPSRN